MMHNNTELNPDKWKNSYKWQFEAYPFFCSVYQKHAKIHENNYCDFWNDFLNHFKGGHLLAFKPKDTLNLKGNLIISELLVGKDDFFVLFKEVNGKIKQAIEKCLQVREQGDFMDLENWWPRLQGMLSEASGMLFPFDFTLNDKMKEWHDEANPIFQILNDNVHTSDNSFFNEAEEMAVKIKNEFHNPERACLEFIKKFGWIQNSYAGMKELSPQWVSDFIKEAAQNKNKSDKNKETQGKYDLLIETASAGITFRDDKKKLLLIGVELMEKWLREICQKNNWKFEELRWLSMDEILLLIKGEKKYLALAEKYAQQNKRIGLMNETGYDDISEEFFEKVMALQLEVADLQEIRGLSGNKGNYRGIARIVTDIERDGRNLKIGDILVTSMTRPEYLPLMKKAGAFVTDEGGITCHAAIIAREMKKPCIIGTKFATQVLKDGDLVEVDADRGVVRILKNVNNNEIQEYRKLMNRSFPLIFFECWHQGERFGLSKISNGNVFFDPLFIYRKNKGTDVLYNFTDRYQNPNLLVEYFENHLDQLELITKKHLENYKYLTNTLKSNKTFSSKNIKEIFSLSLEMLTVLTSMVVISNNSEENNEIIRISNQTRIKTEDFVFQSIDALLQNAVGLLPEDYKKFSYLVTYSEIVGELPTIQELKQRESGYIYYQGSVYTNVDEKEFAQKHNLNIVHDEITISSQVEEIRGKSAFRGKITGKVKVVFEISDMKNIRAGNVLVTPMTTPDLIAVSRDFAAIVTDEGGILCHAAIISREFKKPCIIGTKIATQVLHDGDLVEVDADNGIVKIVEKA